MRTVQSENRNKRAVRKAHFKLNRAFKVIQGDPYFKLFVPTGTQSGVLS